MLHARIECLILESRSVVKHFLLEFLVRRLSEKVVCDPGHQKPARRGRESGRGYDVGLAAGANPTTRDWTYQGNCKFSMDQALRAAVSWEFPEIPTRFSIEARHGPWSDRLGITAPPLSSRDAPGWTALRRSVQ